MLGLIGKKLGMTSFFNEDGKITACTLLEVNSNVVTQVKNEERDGYNSVQLGYENQKDKRVSKALLNHFKKANTTPKKKLVEIRDCQGLELGKEVTIDIFEEGEFVDVIGTSKGKGFQGVVKRHGFHGVGESTHGQHNRKRAPGSIGASSDPSRVFKGMKMAGRMGNDRVKVKNLKVIKKMPEINAIVLSGAVPGCNGSYVIIEK